MKFQTHIGGLRKRLSSPCGETIVETLAAIAVSALAVVMLSTGIAASTRINNDAHEKESAIRAALIAAQDRSGAAEAGTVTVTTANGKTVSYTVDVYGDEVVSYVKQGDGA